MKAVLANSSMAMSNYDTSTQALKWLFLLEESNIMDNMSNDSPESEMRTKVILLNIIVFPGRADCLSTLITMAVAINITSIIVIGYVARIVLHSYSAEQSDEVILFLNRVCPLSLQRMLPSYLSLQDSLSPLYS